MVQVTETQTSTTGSYGSLSVSFPDLSPDRAKLVFETNTSGTVVQPTPPNVSATPSTYLAAGYRLYHKGLTTPKSGSVEMNYKATGASYGFLEATISGAESGALGPTTTSGGYTHDKAVFGNLTLNAGDTSFGVVFVYDRTPTVYSVPEGFTIVKQGTVPVGTNKYSWWAIVMRNSPVSATGTYPGAALNFAGYPNSIGNQVCYTFGVTPSGPEGISFQIMHNGQLIPATPNLWSGGQLTPVGLNLPE